MKGNGVTITVLKGNMEKLLPAEWLVFIPIILDDIRLTLNMRAGDICLSGFQGFHRIFYCLDENVKWAQKKVDESSGQQIGIEETSGNEQGKVAVAGRESGKLDIFLRWVSKVKDCLNIHNLLAVKLKGVGDSYPCLEELSGTNRSELSLGLEYLKEAVRFLGSEEINEEKYPIMAKYLMFLSQFIVEPLRQKAMLEHLLNTFLSNDGYGVRTPLQYIINQHGWAISSELLLRMCNGTKTFEIHMDDPTKPALHAQELINIYGILKLYEGKFLQSEPKKKPEDVNVRLLYMKSINDLKNVSALGMTSNSVNLSTEENHEVDVFKFFSRSHVVFGYDCIHKLQNRVLSNVLVDVSGFDDTDFIRREMTPLKSMSFNSCGQLYAVFQLGKTGSVTCGTFVNSLKWEEDGSENGELRCNLKDIDLIAKDYVFKVEIPNFKDEWEQMKRSKRSHLEGVYDCSSIDLEKIGQFVDQFLGMQVCKGVDDEIPPGTCSIWSLSGFYMGRFKVLAKVELRTGEQYKSTLKLIVRATEKFAGEAIHTIAKSACSGV